MISILFSMDNKYLKQIILKQLSNNFSKQIILLLTFLSYRKSQKELIKIMEDDPAVGKHLKDEAINKLE